MSFNDLRAICPFTTIPGGVHRSFEAITNQDPIKEKGFKEWCNRHIKKILRGEYHLQLDQDESSEESNRED